MKNFDSYLSESEPAKFNADIDGFENFYHVNDENDVYITDDKTFRELSISKGQNTFIYGVNGKQAEVVSYIDDTNTIKKVNGNLT